MSKTRTTVPVLVRTTYTHIPRHIYWLSFRGAENLQHRDNVEIYYCHDQSNFPNYEYMYE
jgi:hypothetical protein